MGLLWLLIKSTLKIAIIDSSLITLLESESPMVEGIKRCPCNPRVGGSIPGTDNLKKLLIWMKIHELHSDGQVAVGQQ